MLKTFVFLVVLACLAWFGSKELESREANVPAGPSVGYPVVEAGDGAHVVGEGTRGALGGP